MPGKRKTDDPGRDRSEMSTRQQSDLSAEDARLWAQVAADTRPLKADKRDSAAKKAPKPDPAKSSTKTAKTKPAAPAPPRPPSAPRPPELSAGASPGVDKRLGDRLRRGQLPIDARVDLHGMTQAEAKTALDDFIVASRHGGRRCVLVITGKGGSRGTDDYGRARPGVLREAVPKWLNTATMRPHILSFAQAQPKHGGAGALYVLLKRLR